MKVTVNKIKSYSLFNITMNQTHIKKTNVRYIFVVDNSGSMKNYPKQLVDILIMPLIDYFNKPNEYVNLLPSILISFSKIAETLSRSISSKSDVESIIFSNRGSTNITHAIQVAYNEIINAHKQFQINDCHNILIFLSDGGHNVGEQMPKNYDHYKNDFESNGIILSVINVGIANCDVVAGTKIKTMETLEIIDMDPIYYVHDHKDIENILKKIIISLNFALKQSNWISVCLENGNFFGDKFVENKCVSDSITLLATTESDKIYINMCEHKASSANIHVENLYSVFEHYIPQLSKLGVTDGKKSIESKLQVLDELIDVYNEQSNMTDIGKTNQLKKTINYMKNSNLNDTISKVNFMTKLTNDPIKKIYNKVMNELLEMIVIFNINKFNKYDNNINCNKIIYKNHNNFINEIKMNVPTYLC